VRDDAITGTIYFNTAEVRMAARITFEAAAALKSLGRPVGSVLSIKVRRKGGTR